MTRVHVEPSLFEWARERSGLSSQDLDRRFARLAEWRAQSSQPTMRQLESFAHATHTPLGFFFLPTPPVERLPIRDLRTTAGQPARPSADLLDTIYAMQRRQAWLREERLESEWEFPEFAGTARLRDAPEAVGQEMRRVVGLDDGWLEHLSGWQEAVGELRRRIEALGVMTIINGVVGNNTHRRLNVREFRGFALTDPHAPVIFVNGADAKSAQMFTMAHELAHVWLGLDGEGLSGFDGIFPGDSRIEQFCDRAAAEFLVPQNQLRELWKIRRREKPPFEELSRRFKVSPIVVGRRAMDLRLVSRETFFEFYRSYTAKERAQKTSGGGNFYSNQNSRVGESFARRVIFAALEGRLSFKEAYRLTDLKGVAFQRYARRLGVELP